MKARITDNNVLILTAQTTDDELMLSKWIEKNSGATANYAIDINSEVNGAETSNEKCTLHDVSQQRELLYGFSTWHNAKPQKERYDMIYVAEIEEFLKP